MGAGGGFLEEAAQGGEQQAFVGQALGAERADEAEHVVDAEVVGEALVRDLVGDEGVAPLTDTGQSGVQFRVARRAEVVALVVAVAGAGGPPVLVEQHEGVLLVGLQGHPRLTVQPENRTDDVAEVAQEPLGGDGSDRASGASGESADDDGEPGAGDGRSGMGVRARAR